MQAEYKDQILFSRKPFQGGHEMEACFSGVKMEGDNELNETSSRQLANQALKLGQDSQEQGS